MFKESKTIVSLIFGGIIAIVISILTKDLPEFNINDTIWVYIILGVSLIMIVVLIYAVQNRVNEIKEDIEKLKLETNKLNENLKIYERLAKIEERLRI